MDSGEGESGSSYLYLGEVAAGGTGSFVVNDLYHNDRKYVSNYNGDKNIYMSTVSGSISGQSWGPYDLGSGVFSQKAFHGSYGGPFLGSDDTRVRWDVTWSGLGDNAPSTGFGDWTVYNSSGVELDLSLGSATYSVTNLMAPVLM